MNWRELIKMVISLHADYHSSKTGLSDKDAEEMLVKIFEEQKEAKDK